MKPYKRKFKEEKLEEASAVIGNITHEISVLISNLRRESDDQPDVVITSLKSIIRQCIGEGLLKSRDPNGFKKIDKEKYTKALKRYIDN